MMSTSKRSTRRVLALAAVALVLFPQPFLSCDAETAGEAIHFKTAVQGIVADGDAVAKFETSKGWRVDLETAQALIGPVYYYGGAPMVRRHRPVFGAGVAMACPTHAQYDFGTVLGEVPMQYVVDLLAETPTSTGKVAGEKGACRSAELHIHPPGDQQLETGSPAEAIDSLDGYAIRLSGTATKDETSMPFSAMLNIPDEGTMRIIQNIEGDVDVDDTAEKQGRIVLKIRVDAWFAQVDFASLTETDDDGVYLFSEDTQARTALLQAVRNRYSYRVAWSKK